MERNRIKIHKQTNKDMGRKKKEKNGNKGFGESTGKYEVVEK